MMGSEPLEEEIPVEFEDFNLDVQEAMNIYHMLQDNWDTMNGTYMGKIYAGLLDIFTLYEIEDQQTMFTLIRKIDEHRGKAIAAQKANTLPEKTAQ